MGEFKTHNFIVHSIQINCAIICADVLLNNSGTTCAVLGLMRRDNHYYVRLCSSCTYN